MQSTNAKGKYPYSMDCEIHAEYPLTFFCMTKSCEKCLCMKCLSDHSLIHSKNGTYMILKEIDQLRKEYLSKLEVSRNTIEAEIDNLKIGPLEKTTHALKKACNEAIENVKEFFDNKLRQLAEKSSSDDNIKLIINESHNMKANDILFKQLRIIENDIQNMKNDMTFLQILRELISSEDLESKLKGILNVVNDPIKLWIADETTTKLNTLLDQNYKVLFNLKNDNSEMIKFPVELRDSDDIVISGPNEGLSLPITIMKKGMSNSASIILAAPFSKGINTYTVRIDKISNNQGWVGIGLINNTNINFKSNNYSNAYCVCSDQSFYKLNVQKKEIVQAGITLTITADFSQLEIKITSDNGLICETKFSQGMLLYPYFELTHPHQLTILSFIQHGVLADQ